ncbi:MAG: SusD/RagB family nutrient-binding outer membrane lipoprotein [Cyclobacteriaceae bacterium]|nr:SusD/RagB family nutrient-binding outer membrane lipoprotein [Cyclobacteriaceae bacterium]MDH4295556.1 SusD/RagB family nutrient-binding outer membrane lipoprotein [Cyclobacteriaceae bacterium]MDH5249129.1 SusD/RagB family nutrient-binding outer membrane lipoprotein [Cyclobacteriaceae bacterium]
MRKIILFIFFTGWFLSCSDRLEELNKPTKDAVAVPAETLFSNGLNNLFFMMNNSDANRNVFRMYAQYWAQTQYPEESQYNMVTRRNPDNVWRDGYRDALQDLAQAKIRVSETWELLGLSEAERDNQYASIDISMVYGYAILADLFGAIPYSEALDINILQPKYDAAEDVYADLITVLDNAIDLIDGGEAGFSSRQDFLYGGDASKWKKFGNSLKLKLAITIADVDAGKAATMISEAVTSGVFTSNADNAEIIYLDAFPNTNPIHEDLVQSGREDYVVANTIVDKLLALSDPRLPVYADPLDDGVTYEGGIYGDNNTFSQSSHIGAAFYNPELPGLLLDYAEVEFYLAEAVERGVTIGGTAAEHYNNAITASMEYWGVDAADIATYLANPAVAYATAEGGGTYKQKIGVQQWIAFFNRGIEGWSTWRRLDFVGFNVPPLLTYNDIPNRFIFPIEEATLNGTNLQAAKQLIGGSDDVQTKVFWDVN